MALKQGRQEAINMLLAATFLAGLATSGAQAIQIEQRAVVTLPSDGEILTPNSLSFDATSGVVLATANRLRRDRAGESIASWAAWAVQGEVARAIEPKTVGDVVQGCVLRSDTQAVCAFGSQGGDLKAAILQLADGSLNEWSTVSKASGATVRGMTRNASGEILRWGLASLRPYAALVDDRGRVKWEFRWAAGPVGDFYDGIATSAGARLLASSRTSSGMLADEITAVVLDHAGRLAASSVLASPKDGKGLPILPRPIKKAPEASKATHSLQDPAAHDALTAAPLKIEGGAFMRLGLLKWAKLDSETVAHLATEGTGSALAVTRNGLEVARVPIAGLPFSGVIAGEGRTIFVLAAAVEPGTPPKHSIRLSRFELSE